MSLKTCQNVDPVHDLHDHLNLLNLPEPLLAQQSLDFEPFTQQYGPERKETIHRN